MSKKIGSATPIDQAILLKARNNSISTKTYGKLVEKLKQIQAGPVELSKMQAINKAMRTIKNHSVYMIVSDLLSKYFSEKAVYHNTISNQEYDEHAGAYDALSLSYACKTASKMYKQKIMDFSNMESLIAFVKTQKDINLKAVTPIDGNSDSHPGYFHCIDVAKRGNNTKMVIFTPVYEHTDRHNVEHDVIESANEIFRKNKLKNDEFQIGVVSLQRKPGAKKEDNICFALTKAVELCEDPAESALQFHKLSNKHQQRKQFTHGNDNKTILVNKDFLHCFAERSTRQKTGHSLHGENLI